MSTSANPPRNVLVTGSSRGIGLEFVSQYVSEPNTHVIATARNLATATALHELKQKHSNLTLVEVDVSSSDSIRDALKSLPPLSLLINNAGIYRGANGLGSATADQLSTTFNTNVTGALLTTQAALPALQQAVEQGIRPVVANIASTMGSLKGVIDKRLFNGTGSVAYRVSKAALNMVTAIAAQEHPDITFISFCPGWVDTDMGRGDGSIGAPPVKPAESISGMRAVLDKLKPEQSGHFFSYDGTEVSF